MPSITSMAVLTPGFENAPWARGIRWSSESAYFPPQWYCHCPFIWALPLGPINTVDQRVEQSTVKKLWLPILEPFPSNHLHGEDKQKQQQERQAAAQGVCWDEQPLRHKSRFQPMCPILHISSGGGEYFKSFPFCLTPICERKPLKINTLPSTRYRLNRWERHLKISGSKY